MKILILTVGGSQEPLIKSINNFKPDRIYFICSDISWKDAGEIIGKTGYDTSNTVMEKLEDYQSSLNSFELSQKFIHDAKKFSDDIIVDFTGGTKTMSTGLFIAALNERCKLNYTGTPNPKFRDKKGLGIVQNDFEEFIKQSDPYEHFAITETDRGISFFNKYQFEASIENFKIAHSKTNDKKLKKKFAIYRELAKIYNYWDKFVENKGSRLDNQLGKIESTIRTFSELTDIEFDFLDKLKDNINFLEKKLNGDISDNIEYYIIDLINNAERRVAEGKFDDALARLYRVVELIAQSKFNDLKLISKKNIIKNKEFSYNLNAFRDNFEPNKFNEVINKFGTFDKNGNIEKIHTSGLFGSYQLLKVIGEDIGDKFIKKYQKTNKDGKPDSVLYSTLNSRNKSILAHGLNPVSENTVKNLLNDIFYFVNMVIDDFQSKKETGEFLTLS